DRPVSGLRARKKIDLIFDYRGQVITFTVEVININNELITAVPPEFLYKNLDRSFSRVQTPPDLQVQFTFLGDRYSLAYPKVGTYENGEKGDLVQSIDPKNLTGLVDQMAAWIKGFANGYKLVIFKDVKPTVTEEYLVAETGKTFFLPSTNNSFPLTDPYPKSRLVTEDIFKRYLESTGVDPANLDETCSRFIKTKLDSGIFSDLWVPVLFQEYVIGYIHAWINREGKLPFDFTVIDTLYQFAAILANSLKLNGYFENGKMKGELFEGKVIDISAGGLLFVYPNSSLAASLLPNQELTLKLISPRRTVTTNAQIVRRYKDNTQGYFGVRFIDMAPEDLRFLFEFIYGKPFTDTDAMFLAGQV
ncbi:MAG: PilZ domain-containing protein, partial [Treponema sp.]|nr:PilZ domain-containing protein [Treponema sp.]